LAAALLRCVASSQILLFLRRFSLRHSAYLGVSAVTVISPQSALRYAEGAEKKNFGYGSAALRLCDEKSLPNKLSAEIAEVTQRLSAVFQHPVRG
jgi:hypothetical protein